MQIYDKRLDEIKPYENNPRHNDNAVDAVANSIREFGFKVPLVVDSDGVIVAGHTRYKAAKRLGLKTVPCLVADDLNEEQINAFRLADNKVGELATWDLGTLKVELDNIGEVDLSGMGFDLTIHDEYTDGKEFFERDENMGANKQEGNDEYNEFLDKFETKKTTDDCYTPKNIYQAVADYVAETYQLNKENFVRPFYPNGDYQKFKYAENSVVVDNPPFSIMANILAYYNEHGIKYFLFAPTLTSMWHCDRCCFVGVGASVVYENGANVNTSFLTNLEDTRAKSEPNLYDAIDRANKKNIKNMHRQLPTYKYPSEVVTATGLVYLSRYGVSFDVSRDESVAIRELDAQKEQNKTIFGGGVLVSQAQAQAQAQAYCQAQEKEQEIRLHEWELSDREKDIVRGLGNKGGVDNGKDGQTEERD